MLLHFAYMKLGVVQSLKAFADLGYQIQNTQCLNFEATQLLQVNFFFFQMQFLLASVALVTPQEYWKSSSTSRKMEIITTFGKISLEDLLSITKEIYGTDRMQSIFPKQRSPAFRLAIPFSFCNSLLCSLMVFQYQSLA